MIQRYAPKQAVNVRQSDVQAKKISVQAQAPASRAKLENDFKAEINSRLEKQWSELVAMDDESNAFITRDKELEFSNYIFKNYLLGQDGKIHPLNWYQLTDIVDYIAHHTRTDAGFRIVLWGLFGATIPGEHIPLLTRFVDNKNPGLQERYLNDGYDQEQIHHYLAGVTGDFNNSHKYNNCFGLHSKSLRMPL